MVLLTVAIIRMSIVVCQVDQQILFLLFGRRGCRGYAPSIALEHTVGHCIVAKRENIIRKTPNKSRDQLGGGKLGCLLIVFHWSHGSWKVGAVAECCVKIAGGVDLSRRNEMQALRVFQPALRCILMSYSSLPLVAFEDRVDCATCGLEYVRT
jgi:hypothetical protein